MRYNAFEVACVTHPTACLIDAPSHMNYSLSRYSARTSPRLHPSSSRTMSSAEAVSRSSSQLPARIEIIHQSAAVSRDPADMPLKQSASSSHLSSNMAVLPPFSEVYAFARTPNHPQTAATDLRNEFFHDDGSAHEFEAIRQSTADNFDSMNRTQAVTADRWRRQEFPRLLGRKRSRESQISAIPEEPPASHRNKRDSIHPRSSSALVHSTPSSFDMMNQPLSGFPAQRRPFANHRLEPDYPSNPDYTVERELAPHAGLGVAGCRAQNIGEGQSMVDCNIQQPDSEPPNFQGTLIDVTGGNVHSSQTSSSPQSRPKKLLHREVEQARRQRMTTQVDQLRSLLSPTRTRVDKVSVLQAAVSYISDSKQRISDLESKLSESGEEIQRLRSALEAKGSQQLAPEPYHSSSAPITTSYRLPAVSASSEGASHDAATATHQRLSRTPPTKSASFRTLRDHVSRGR